MQLMQNIFVPEHFIFGILLIDFVSVIFVTCIHWNKLTSVYENDAFTISPNLVYDDFRRLTQLCLSVLIF